MDEFVHSDAERQAGPGHFDRSVHFRLYQRIASLLDLQTGPSGALLASV